MKNASKDPTVFEEISPVAIASLVLASLGAVSFELLSVVGVLCGMIARHQIKRGIRKGYPLAQAGIIVGSVVIAFWLFVPALALGEKYVLSKIVRFMTEVPRELIVSVSLFLMVAGLISGVVAFVFLTRSKRKEKRILGGLA